MNNTLVRGRMPKAPEEFISVDYVINDAVAAKMYNALMVVINDPNIESFLHNLDPQAYKQCCDAVMDYVSSYQESNIDNHNNL